MESKLQNEHAPPGADAPFMKLPEQVDGFIDVQTLIDIQNYLSESENTDDVALAAWVKENYLYKPMTEEVRQIRDTEGFVKLDAAYRRVRLLTGKAQDKWPFFDRNWKKMPPTVVKHVVLGNTGIITNLPVTNDEVRDSPMSNDFDGHHDSALHEPNFQVPLGTETLTRYQVQSQMSSQPAALVPDSKPMPDEQPQHQALEPIPEPRLSSASGNTIDKKIPDIYAPNSTVNGAVAPTNLLRDTEADKVRGSYGRFLNKNEFSSAKRKGPNIKYVKKARSKATPNTGNEEEAYSSNEVKKSSQVFYAVASGPSSDNDDEVTQSSTPESTKDTQITHSSFNGSPASSILAAEAEAVPSNLDRLPPGLTGKKRKSEPAIQRGGNKRARGSRGGMLGRPRKLEPVSMDFRPNTDEGTKIEWLPSKVGNAAKMATRRGTRKSALSTTEPPASIEPSRKTGSHELPQQKSDDKNTHHMMENSGIALGSDGSAKTKLNEITSLNGIDKPTHDVFSGSSSGFDSISKSFASTSQAPDTQKARASSKQKKRVSFTSETEAGKTGNVEFFARVSTNGIREEIRLSEEDLVSGVDLVKRYAAWQKSGKASSVTFETFKNIVEFAK